MTYIENKSRRKFLKDMAKAGALLPFAGKMLSQNALAASGYKNVIFMYTPNGVHDEHWAPSQGTGPIATQGELSFSLGSLKDWHNNIIVLKNVYIDIQGDNFNPGAGMGHGDAQAGCLTGNFHDQNIPSIDHLIAEKLGDRGVLNLGVRTGNEARLMISKPRNGSRQPPNNNPFDVATKLKTLVTPTPADPLQSKVYAAAIADMNALSEDKLSGDRQSKVEQHQAALTKLKDKQQEGVDKFPFDFDTIETVPISSGSIDPSLFAQFPALCKSQVNNIVAAFANGLHRVACLQLSVGNENPGRVNYSFDECWEMTKLAHQLRPGDAFAERNEQRNHGDHASHNASHKGGSTSFRAQSRWHNSLLAYTLQQLKDKEILDQTLVVLFSEVGDGLNHTLDQGSIVVAGGTGGGALAMGRVIDCGASSDKGTHELFGDIARLVGAPLTEGPWKRGIL